MREFMKIVESSEVDRLTALAKKHDDVESFLDATDGMDVLYRGHGEDEVPNDSFMSDYIGHARGYGGGHVDAFAVDLYNDVYRFRDDQFDQMRFALLRLDDDEFAEHYARVLPERMSGFFDDWFPIVKQVIEDDEPFEEAIATDPQKNDAMIPLMQAWAATKGKNIICFMGGDYGDYGGQMEFVVHDVSKLVNLRKLYAEVHQQITEGYLESGRAPLYHWTNPESARYILEKGKITASLFGVGQVCVTRDKNFHFNKNCVRIEIDADVVGRNLKVTPYDYSHNGHSWGTAERKEEREERIHGDVSIRAIKSITLFDNGFIFKNDYWTKQANALIANAKAAGIPLTIEESPHKVAEALSEGVESGFKLDRNAWLKRLAGIANTRTIATVLEDHESDEADLIAMWFDSVMAIFARCSKLDKIEIYRHVRVDEFDGFLEDMDVRGVGQHWSIHYGTESPNWTHDGDVDVMMFAEITPSQVDWEQTLTQMFEWPEEGELIFSGNVFLKSVENMDEQHNVPINRVVRR